MADFFDEGRPHNGHTYDEYRAYWQEQIEQSQDAEDADDRRLHHYLTYNWQRQAHVHDEYTPSPELADAVSGIGDPQLWMVLTEPWCGDSAFLLPVIAEAAALNQHITLRILLRDENLDIMDQYLTEGGRSIPKLVAFSDDGTERFTWGPRPETVRTLFAELQEKYDEKMEATKHLISHYEDGAWRDADPELAHAIQNAHSSTAT